MEELYDEIINLIDSGTKLIDDRIKKAEMYLVGYVQKLLSSYNNKGTLEKDETDYQLSKKVKEGVSNALNKSGYLSALPQFEKLIDKIEKLTKRIAIQVNSGVVFNKDVINLTQSKKLALEQIAAALSSPQSIKANITGEVQKIIYQSIANQIRYKDAIDILKPLIAGDAKMGGLLSRYYKQVTYDALNQWSGVVNESISNEYGLIDFKYVGSIKQTSRPQCVRWVIDLGGIMIKEVVEAEMKEAVKTVRKPNSKFGGYSIYAVPTAGNFARIRGGHNCEHMAVPFLATEQEAEANINKYNSLGNSISLKYQKNRK